MQSETQNEKLKMYIVIPDAQLVVKGSTCGILFADAEDAIALAFKEFEGRATIVAAPEASVLWSGLMLKGSINYDERLKDIYAALKEVI